VTRRTVPTAIVVAVTFVALAVGACTSNGSPGAASSPTHSATSSPTPNPTPSSVKDNGNASFAYGTFVTFTKKGFVPHTLLAPMGAPIVWRNATTGPVVIHFDNYGSAVTSGSIAPGGTWSFNPNAQLSIAYHGVWHGQQFRAFVQTQLVGNSGP
jgi:hypothetical protein